MFKRITSIVAITMAAAAGLAPVANADECTPYDGSTSALYFDGEATVVTGGTVAPMTLTIEAWVQPEVLPQSTSRIFSNGWTSFSDTAGIAFGQTQGGRLIFTVFGDFDYITQNVYLTPGVWTHVAVTFLLESPSTVEFFVNGQFVEKVVAPMPGNTLFGTAYRIGGNTDFSITPKENWVGAIDEVRLWNVARSHAQIQSSYKVAIGPQNGLWAYWRFGEGFGGVAHNSIQGIFHGAIHGAKWIKGSYAPLDITKSHAVQANEGELVTLTVMTLNAGTYWWRKNGVLLWDNDGPYAGTATPTLTILSAKPEDFGLYDALVTNACGTTVTAPIALGVTPLPSRPSCAGDLNADNVVGIADLLMLLANWGPCP